MGGGGQPREEGNEAGRKEDPLGRFGGKLREHGRARCKAGRHEAGPGTKAGRGTMPRPAVELVLQLGC
jgi:hypothetical protein